MKFATPGHSSVPGALPKLGLNLDGSLRFTGVEADWRYTYDAQGNLDGQYVGATLVYDYTFDAENRLAAVTTNNQTTTFAYDADGQRILTSRPDGTIVYTPFPDYEREVGPGGAVTERTTYSIAGQMVAVRAAGILYYTYSDHLGSVVGMTNATGGIIANSLARYDPFGNYRTAPTTNPGVTDRGFTGHVHDNTGAYPTQNVGLIYMNARYYLPEIGRFISADTIVPDPGNPQSYNRYAYVQNSPLNFIDPTGHNRDCGMGDPVCNGDRSAMAGGWGSLSQQAFVDPLDNYYASGGFGYDPGLPGERSNAVSGGTVHNGVDLKSLTTTDVVALSTGIVRVADPCTIDPCNGYDTADANLGTGSVVIVEYPYEVIPDQVREDFGMTSDMSLYVQYQHLDEIALQIVAGRAVTANDVIGQYGNTGSSGGPHLHFESHVGPSQALGMGRIDGAYGSPSNNRNWHNILYLVDPNVILNNSATPR